MFVMFDQRFIAHRKFTWCKFVVRSVTAPANGVQLRALNPAAVKGYEFVSVKERSHNSCLLAITLSGSTVGWRTENVD